MSSNQPIPGGNSTINSARAVGDTTAASRDSILPEDSLPSRARQAFSTLHRFEDSLKNMAKCSPIFSDVEKAVERLGATELDIQAKNKRISDLESANEVQIEKFCERFSQWKEEKGQLEKKLADDKVSMEKRARSAVEKQRANHMQSIENLNKELAKEKENTATLRGDLGKETAKTQEMRSKLSDRAKQLKEWELYLSDMRDVDFNFFESRIKKLFNHCYTIAQTCFINDLPATVFADEARWDNQTSLLKVPLSFPPSNSPSAKSVRMAASLVIFARNLCTNIFKPCYHPEPTVDSETMRRILRQQFTKGRKKELLTRALLLSTYDPGEVDAATKKAVSTASKDVFTLLDPIISHPNFRSEVEKLFQEAADVWKLAQYSKKMVDVFTTQQDPSWLWEHLEEFDSVAAENNVQPPIQGFEMLDLFPAICIPEEDRVIYQGSVLWHDQTTVLGADRELREFLAAKRSRSGRSVNVSGGPIRRERRPSMVSNVRNGVTGLLRSNSGAEDPTRFLGPQRVQPQGNQNQNRTGGEG